MAGFLGGGSGGSGGEIQFPAEFIDPVTKLRVSEPQTLIDTDFEYGLQPTKWETVELINNTPSFFSKGGDTTIPNIASVTTTATSREIKVTTSTPHGLAVGIPINVTATKSITADGAYIINSIPDPLSFTYLGKEPQDFTASIFDLYTSIITGEFFQGSQIRISDSQGIVTNGTATSPSVLTVQTDSPHGFQVGTPFYFLNLNSTVSQQFDSSNTGAKTFDASNSATAQTFDGSNSATTYAVDLDNKALTTGTPSTTVTFNAANKTITVNHSTEGFSTAPFGAPIYYNVTAASDYFLTNPRGVVYLAENGFNVLGGPNGTSTFSVSTIPGGPVLSIPVYPNGTFQLATDARTFAGNNINPLTQSTLTIVKEEPIAFDGGNQGYAGAIATNGVCTVEGYGGTILVSTTSGAGLDYYPGAMVRYTVTGGSAAGGLTNNETYFINTFATTATPNQYRITIKALPDSVSALAPTAGSGTDTFTKIGVSTTKEIVHIRNANFAVKDMLEYSFPVGGRFTTAETAKQFYFVEKAYDSHNYQLTEKVESYITATGGVTSDIVVRGANYKVHTFTTVGNTTFTVSDAGSTGQVEYLIVAGGGGGGDSYGGGGGGAGGVLTGTATVTAQAYTITVGGGGNAGGNASSAPATAGANSVALGLTATGGGRGGGQIQAAGVGGSGGGGAAANQGASLSGASGTSGQGTAGGTGITSGASNGFHGAGGGGKDTAGTNAILSQAGRGGEGILSTITGAAVFYGGGGGGGQHSIGGVAAPGGNGGGGLGGAYNPDDSTGVGRPAQANTGGGGGGAGGRYGINPASAGVGGSGIVVLRYPTTAPTPLATAATGGTTTTTTVGDTTYRVHSFTTVGNSNFVVTTAGNLGPAEYLIVAGGGGGGGRFSNTTTGGGGGAGGFITGSVNITAQTYPITVGDGGPSVLGSGADAVNPVNGGNSTAFGLTAIGGGRGGSWDGGTDTGRRARSGGSGGGQSDTSGTNGDARTGGAGTPGQGFAGGNGPAYAGGTQMGSGGGGGAGSPGANGYGDPSAGAGGAGRISNITGTSLIYAAGGGGGIGNGGSGGAGTSGVSGNGGTYRTNGQAAPANRGGGGGGGGGTLESADAYSGGAGGSGIVVIRYPISITGII
jgi:hypothetical protein